MNDVTRILSPIEHGDPPAAEQLLPLVYDELRKLAAAEAGPGEAGADAPGHGAGPRGVPPAGRTARPGPALGQPRPLLRRRGRGHAAHPRRAAPAARAARSAAAAAQRVDLDDVDLPIARDRRWTCSPWTRPSTRLAAEDPAKAELVKLRYFAGLTHRGGGRGARASRARPPTATGPTPGPGCDCEMLGRRELA